MSSVPRAVDRIDMFLMHWIKTNGGTVDYDAATKEISWEGDIPPFGRGDVAVYYEMTWPNQGPHGTWLPEDVSPDLAAHRYSPKTRWFTIVPDRRGPGAQWRLKQPEDHQKVAKQRLAMRASELDTDIDCLIKPLAAKDPELAARAKRTAKHVQDTLDYLLSVL